MNAADPLAGTFINVTTIPADQGKGGRPALNKQSPFVVERITRLDTSGNVKAFVDISIGGKLTISGYRVIQQQGQRAYVAAPQQEYTDRAGQKRYYPVVIWHEARIKDAIQKVILDAWQATP